MLYYLSKLQRIDDAQLNICTCSKPSHDLLPLGDLVPGSSVAAASVPASLPHMVPYHFVVDITLHFVAKTRFQRLPAWCGIVTPDGQPLLGESTR